MATTKRAASVAKARVKKFNTLQDLVNHLNAGKPVISLTTNSGAAIGMSIYKNPNANCVVQNNSAYCNVMINGSSYTYNWTLTYVGYESASTKIELEEDLQVIQAELSIVKAKLAYLDETKQEEFDETEFKVWNTLQVLGQKKTTDLEKARAIAALIKA